MGEQTFYFTAITMFLTKKTIELILFWLTVGKNYLYWLTHTLWPGIREIQFTSSSNFSNYPLPHPLFHLRPTSVSTYGLTPISFELAKLGLCAFFSILYEFFCCFRKKWNYCLFDALICCSLCISLFIIWMPVGYIRVVYYVHIFCYRKIKSFAYARLTFPNYFGNHI